MTPVGKQGRSKARQRSVDMSADETGSSELWARPPEDECDVHPHTLQLPNSSVAENRLKIRLVRHRFTWEVVEFAIVYQTFYKRQWRDVVSIDSCHDRDVHLHRYARRTGKRVPGGPEKVRDLVSLADVEVGYDEALRLIEDRWDESRERWHHA
jgi:hypothetical protein